MIYPGNKENEDMFAINCFLKMMKSNIALNPDYKEMILDMAAENVVKGKLSREFFNQLTSDEN